MTVDAYAPSTVTYTIAGAGPYTIDHAYDQVGDFAVTVIAADGSRTALTLTTDYTISPAGPASSGSLTLTSGAATMHGGLTLEILRDTDLEQGWQGVTPREQGVETQLDRMAMGIQEARRDNARSLKVLTGPSEPFTPEDGKVIVYDAARKSFVNGPTTDEVSNAQSYSVAAGAAQTAAEAAQAASEAAQLLAEAAEAGATAARTAAEEAKTQAELYAIAAGAALFSSTADGLAGTASGEFFIVVSSLGFAVYENVAGSESFIGWLGQPLFDSLVRVFPDLATIRAASLPDHSVLMIASSGARYNYNASSQRPDDGTYAVHDADGRVFDRVSSEETLGNIDLIVVVGQSNAEGRGDSASSPASPEGIEINGSTVTDPLADPVGGAATGSMWPAFANEWYLQTGRRLAVAEAADGGSALLPDAGGEWSSSGSLRAAAVTAAEDAMAAIWGNYAGFAPGDVYFVWAQGEADAQAYNGTTITGAAYKTALKDLANYFEAQVPEFTKMGVVRLGSKNNRDEAADWAEFRQAQEDACTEAANLIMLYRGSTGFAYDGRRLMDDDLHWGQSGLNIAGELAATALATGASPSVPSAPSILATAVFEDTDPTVNETTRTDSHTTASGTKMLLVAVTSEVVNNNVTRNVDSVTFDGVAMTEAKSAFAGVAAGDSVSPGRVDVGLFFLTETDYGASLDGVTGDIVTTLNGATNMLSAVAVDLDEEAIQEAGFTDNFGGSFGGTPTDTMSAVLVAGAPCLVVAIQSTVATSGTPLTHSLAGAMFTEVTDNGGDNGSGKSGQRVVATASVAEGVHTVTGTLSANADCGVLYVVGFRGKIPGE